MTTASARHILVKTEDQCNDLIKKIQDGSDFKALAAEFSECPSGQQSGELGTFSRGQMVPEFDRVVFEETVGLYPQAVKTDFGYHVIEVTERNDD